MKQPRRSILFWLLFPALFACEPAKAPPDPVVQASAAPAQPIALPTSPVELTAQPAPTALPGTSMPPPPATPPGESPLMVSVNDPLPTGAIRRLGTNRLWTNGYVYGLAFSADSNVLTSINYLGLVQRWSAVDGREIDRFIPKGAAFSNPFALSPRGTLVGVAERDQANSWRVAFWDIATKSLKGHRKLGDVHDIEQIAVLENSRLAAANADGFVRYFEPAATSPTLALRGTGGREGKVADGHSRMDVIEERGVSLSPDGKWLGSIHRDGTVRIYSLPKGTQQYTFLSSPQSPAPVFSADSARFAYISENGVRAVELEKGRQDNALPQGQCDSVLALAFSPDGARLAASTDNRAICVWNLTTKGAPEVRRVHGDRVEQLAFSPDGALLASGGRDGAIFVWKIPSLEPALAFARHLGRVDGLALSPDGKRAATGGVDGAVYIWDLATGKAVLRRDNPHRFSKPWSDHPVQISPDGKIVYSSTTAGALVGWAIETGAEVFRHEPGIVGDLALSPDGKQIAMIDSWGALSVMSATSGSAPRSLTPQKTYGSFHVEFSPSGKLLAWAGSDGPLSLLDLSTGKALSEQKGQAYSFFFAPDGKRVGVLSYNKLTFYQIDAKSALREESSIATRGPVALSADQHFIAVATGNSSMELRERASGKALATFAYNEGTENFFMTAAAFTPDNAALAVSYQDGTTILWRVK